MNVLGHVGLTLGVAYSVDSMILRRSLIGDSQYSGGRIARYVERVARFDYRMVVLGAMVPDIIDKPVGFWFAPDLVNHSLRSVGHSGLFALTLVAVSLLALLWSRYPGFLALATASAGHLVLDQMWRNPDTLLWPALGLQFPRGTISLGDWAGYHMSTMISQPFEILGGLAIIAFLARIYRTAGVRVFMRSGLVA